MQNPELVLETLPVDLEATLQLGYALISRGSLETARDVFDGLTRQPLESEHAQQVSRGLNRIGDVLLELENVPGALMAYRAGLEIRQVLAQRDLGNMQWQRDLSLSQDKIGNVLEAEGDSREALAAYRAGLEIRKALVEQEPDSTQWQRDLSWTHDRIGDVLLSQGDSHGALAAYRAGLEIRIALTELEPDNTQWQRDVSLTHDNIGDALQAKGDSFEALAAYRTSLEIAAALAQRDPGNTEWQRDLSISHNKIGDALVEQGHGRKARASYLAGLEILEALACRDPQNIQWRMDQAGFLAKLASLDCLMARNVRRDYLKRSRDILVGLKSQGRSEVNEELIDCLDHALRRTSWRSWNTIRADMRVVGIGLLAVHIFRNSFVVEPGLVAMYLAIVLSVGFAFVVVIYPALDWASRTQQMATEEMSEQAVSEIKRHPIRLALLIPGEDGIFFVPLLWVGITPLTAGVAAAAFAAVHYPEYSIRACVPKFVFLFGIAMVVLPHGIGSVVVGHLLVDAMAFTALNLLSDDEATASSPVDTASVKP